MGMATGDPAAGKRLEEELIRVYGSKKAAADAMGMKDGSYWTTYVKGRNSIGGILQKRLIEAGLDVQYILTGIAKTASAEADACVLEIERLKRRMDLVTDDLKEISRAMDKLARLHS
ncbi:MAG: hypothetical protein HGA41_09685 [Syntrophaceae bacterium]|nr:hypothetical protein [Syntrophaceae bacterium]NTW67221.1 hypothetical protein [Nitrospirota bacterium]